MIVSRSQIGHVRVLGPAERMQHAEADERADHEHVAVREVQELEDAVDERVAERDQRVDAAERERVDGELDEGVHVVSQATCGGDPLAGRPRTLLPIYLAGYRTSLYEPLDWIWKM